MRFWLSLLILPVGVAAQDMGDLACAGSAPVWTMDVVEDIATLDYLRTTDMDLMFTTLAEGAEWPRAHTFVGRGDTAIVIVGPPRDDGTQTVHVLTQRGEMPLLLIGTCTPVG